jgi:ribonuclease-3
MAEAPISPGELEERLGYRFTDQLLLKRALTHPSFCHGQEEAAHNQRLEFLGDAILGMVVAEALYHELPEEREGVLTRYRSMLVKGDQLCQLARELRLGEFIRLGESEAGTGGRDRPSILEDALEAVIGAIYLDSGLEAARDAALRLYGSLHQRLEKLNGDHNPKGRLQELLQPRLGNEAIEYRLAGEEGPDHRKQFTVEVWIQGKCRGSGIGDSKKLAEEAAASEALKQIDEP